MRFQFKPNLNNPDQPPIIFARDPESNKVILATRFNIETQEREWHVAKLRDLADALGIGFGALAEAGGNDTGRFELMVDQYNQIFVGTISWSIIEPSQGNYDFTIPDGYTAFATNHHLKITAGHLVWGYEGGEIPDWLKNGDFTREQLIEIMKNHVRTVMERYEDRVYAWIVVNEATEPSTFWYENLGSDEYVDIAFQTAREVDPNAVLIYNDFGNEFTGAPKVDRVFNLVRRLKN